ncbi:MAG: hypothetical protein JXQ96_04890 [Cyclobacteriaceae bacterium]
MKNLLFVFCSVLVACTPSPDPQVIIDKSILAHGGEKFEKSVVSYDFRDKHYTGQSIDGKAFYTREFADSIGFVRDELSNSTELKRYINDTLVELSPEWQVKYANSVNSVLYFFQLPYGLNDPAVRKKYIGEIYINKEPYHKIQITFGQQDGGVDFEDVFVYWIHQHDFTLDYLAYSYITDGGGTRFRQAINRRKVNGIIVQDYVNMKAESKNVPVEKHDQYFIDGRLLELSRIINENVVVKKAK